ncbi:glucosamine inositolphosphorylceramide transferase family protein [Citrobacter freundii]|uniref:glucosamine inositolphosphorylceramide transferase family protein n=1 Tax=Citrobacter freundii TaxID=546 RepID=UPI003879B2B4
MTSLLYKLFGQDIWRIGLVKLDGEINNLLWEGVNWLDIHGGSDYEADPFIFMLGSKYYIAYERFNYCKGNAKIECIDLSGKHYNFFDDLNCKHGHKSFPFIFYDNDCLYCLPETADMHALELYKFDINKNKFIFHCDLMKDVRKVDSFIYKKNSTYFLFTSEITSPQRLELFFSEDIEGPYVLHPSSPIADNSAFGRNGGGIINIDSSLYRVAQNCSTTYGGGLNLMKIDVFDELNYKETLASEILPISPYKDGIHTFSRCNEYIVIDGKVSIYRLSNLFRKSMYKLLKLLKVEL